MRDEFDLDAGLFMHVRRACGTEETRPWLTGVLIEPHPGGGCLMVADDGRVMLAAHDTSATAPRAVLAKLDLCEGPDEPEVDEWGEVLPVPSFDDGRMAFALAGDAPAVAVIARNSCSDWRRGVIEEVCEAGKYPDWRRALRARGKVKPPPKGFRNDALNPDVLARASGGRAVRIDPPDTLGGPMRLHFDLRPEICGPIMPRRAKIQPPAFEMDILEGGDT